MSILLEELDRYLAKEVEARDFARSLEQILGELSEGKEQTLKSVEKAPDFLMRGQKDDYIQSCMHLERALDDAVEALLTNRPVESILEVLPKLNESVLQSGLALRELAWLSHGPSTHSGLNQLLFNLDAWLENPSEESWELVLAHCEIEQVRSEIHHENLENLPEFAAATAERLLLEYQDLIGRLASLDESGDSPELLVDELEDWGRAYTENDIEFVQVYYSGHPTALPAVNFALNAQMRRLDELASLDLVLHAVEIGVETVDHYCGLFLEDQSLSEGDKESYEDSRASICESLEVIPDVANKDELVQRGQSLVELCEGLLAMHAKYEDQGSRLDAADDSI